MALPVWIQNLKQYLTPLQKQGGGFFRCSNVSITIKNVVLYVEPASVGMNRKYEIIIDKEKLCDEIKAGLAQQNVVIAFTPTEAQLNTPAISYLEAIRLDIS